MALDHHSRALVEVALDHHSRALVGAQAVMKIQAPVVSILESSFFFFPSPLTSRKHRCGTRGAAPASDAAGRSNAQGTLLPARPAASRCFVPHGFHVIFTDSCRRGFDLDRNQADSGRNSNKKRKKKVQNTPFDLILNPTLAQFH